LPVGGDLQTFTRNDERKFSTNAFLAVVQKNMLPHHGTVPAS
jgi:hypothetical protein